MDFMIKIFIWRIHGFYYAFYDHKLVKRKFEIYQIQITKLTLILEIL